MTGNEFLDKAIENLILILLGIMLTGIGRLLGFVFSDLLTGRTIATLALVFLVVLSINSSVAGWITLFVFVAKFGWILFRYLYGPAKGAKIVFAGFYDSSGKAGYFGRTGLSKFTDASFFKTLEQTLVKTGLLNVRPLSLVAFRPPALIHRFCDHERFQKLASRYAKKSLGCIWGTVDSQGVPRNIEILLNTELYHGRGSAQDLVNVAINVLNITSLRPEEKISFISKVLGALWGNSFSNDLAEEGRWNEGLVIAEKSLGILASAYNQLEVQIDGNDKRIFEEIKNSLIPVVQVEIARNRLYGGQPDEAFEVLMETLFLNPIFPFRNQNEFGDFFKARFTVEVTTQGPYSDEAIDKRLRSLAEPAQLHTSPNLQLLIDWLYSNGKEIANLETKIDLWFQKLNRRFPNNPFILLYWAEAIKVPCRLGLRPDLAPGPEGELPLSVIDATIKKYESALELAPTFHLISTKIAMNYLVTAQYFSPLSLDYRVRMKKHDVHVNRAKIDMSDRDQDFAETELDWAKFGLTNEFMEELQSEEPKNNPTE